MEFIGDVPMWFSYPTHYVTYSYDPRLERSGAASSLNWRGSSSYIGSMAVQVSYLETVQPSAASVVGQNRD